MITRYNNRVDQIVLSTAEHVLANGIHIGIDIKNVLEVTEIQYKRRNTYTDFLHNFFRAETYYQSSIMMDTDDRGIITRIQLDGPSEP